MALTGKNISLPIYYKESGVETAFHDLVLHKFTVDSVVMSLGDKITGDVYYNGTDLECTMTEFVVFNDVEYTIVNPPTLLREGLVSDNSDLKGMSKYSFEFYHPMYILGNLPFSDVAVSYDELRYKSQDKTFSWIGKPADFVAKLNKNLDGTEWVVVLSDSIPNDTLNTLSEVLSFDKDTIADALKKGYETWGTPFVVDKLYENEYFHTDANHNNTDYYDEGKRFVVLFGLPSNDIIDSHGQPFVFQYGQGVGLKNNSRTPRNNKIVTRIAGYGSENNIPYGYPQVRWYGNQQWDYTINNTSGMQTITVNGRTFTAMSYPIYKGIVGGEYVKLIKHPFTRTHLMPSIYANDVFNKVSQYNADGTANTNYNPNIEIKDYYDAVANESGYDYVNLINTAAPSYEIHGFDDIKPELGVAQILGATPINSDLTDADAWDDTMDDDGNYLQSYFKITLPQLTFDIYACAAITEEMQINMRSGACIGCTFTVQVDWEDYKVNFYNSDGEFAPDGEQRDLTKYPNSANGSITVIVQKDINTFGTIMPNIYQYPHDGDTFVVLGISLPLEYITDAQGRLDAAMKSYMLENNVYYYDYPLKFDEFFLANNTDILNQIRPNTMIRFEFNGDELELYVKQLTMKFNESPLPQYDITLTDNIEVVLNQIGRVAEDVYHLGTAIAMLRQQFGKNVYVELAKKLSKVENDSAMGLITFLRGLDVGTFVHGDFLGSGAHIGADGKGEFEELVVRGSLKASELVFNLIDAEEGEAIRSIGHGEIESVEIKTATTGIATLKLESEEWATIDTGDICRGMFNTIGKNYDNANVQATDTNGFQNKKGFFASYFRVDSFVENGKGVCKFNYTIQNNHGNASTEHPCALMKFAVYGNDSTPSKPERESCMYISANGIAPRLLFLAGVRTWQIKPEHYKLALGNIDGLPVWEEVDYTAYNEYEGVVGTNKKTWTEEVDGETITHYAVINQLVGDAGFYCEDNIYLGGVIQEIKAAALDAVSSSISNLGQSYVWSNNNSFIVDCDANATVLDDNVIQVEAKLYFGSEICDITSATFSGLGETSSGTLSQDHKSVTFSRTIAQGTTNFNSLVLSVNLTGEYNNVEYTASKSITIFANKQGASGTSGTSSAWIDVIPTAISIDCKPDGKIQSTHTETIAASMFVGNSLETSLTNASLTYDAGNGNYIPTIGRVSINNGVASWQVQFSNTNTPLTASSFNVMLTNGTYTVNKTIPVFPIRQGVQGDSTTGYSAQLTKSSDTIVVDGVGNIVGGLTNRLYTSVNIWDAQNETLLDYISGAMSGGTYTLSVSATNCTYSIDGNGKITIGSITDTALDACSLGITVQTYDGAMFYFIYSVTIAHIDQSYITFDLTNEYDSISYSTQQGKYIGLPVETWIVPYLNTESGNVRIGYDEESEQPTITNGYIGKVRVECALLRDGYLEVMPRLTTDSSTGDVIGISTKAANEGLLDEQGNDSNLRLRINSNGRVWITGTTSDADLIDSKHYFDINCEVVVGGVTYNSPKKRFTLSEVTDTTVYKLLLSATSVSKEESTYTPNSISVKVSATDNSGIVLYNHNPSNDTLTNLDDEELQNQNIKVRFINGTYQPSGNNSLLATCPQFDSLTNKILTVVLVDLTNQNSPEYIDIQTVTINEGGKDGAGQSWVNSNLDQIVIDCEADNAISQTRQYTIIASLRWGDDNCDLYPTTNQSMSPTFPSGTGSINESGITTNSTDGGKVISVKKTFIFVGTRVLNSGYITINLVGTLNGVTHTATKTVAVIANKRGDDGEGEEGRGIVSVNTYYKRSTEFSGITPPALDVDPTNDGWILGYIEPTDALPYLWRFTRTTYNKAPLVEQGDAEMIYIWQEVVNPNLLGDTEFTSIGNMNAWTSYYYKASAIRKWSNTYTSGSVEYKSRIYSDNSCTNFDFVIDSTNQCNGHNSYKARVLPTNSLVNNETDFAYPFALVLNQILHNSSVNNVSAGTWYTLSFWHKGDAVRTYIDCIKLGVKMYVDGTETDSAYDVLWQSSQDFVRHTLTFVTIDTFNQSTNYQVQWNMPLTKLVESLSYLCMPKLEIGKVATSYRSMSVIKEPITRTSTWEEGKQYYKGAYGEPYLDITSKDGGFYRCERTHFSTQSNAPAVGASNATWSIANDFRFIATDLLLADEAVIRLMFSQKILMTNASNQLIASMNADKNGSYYIYYPDTGNRRMALCYDGYIRYWNNDALNTQRWRLGQGGEIEMEDRWDSIWLKSLGSDYTDDYGFNANTRYELVEYHQFISSADGQDIDQNMEIHTSEDLASNLIDDGYYTPNERPTKTYGTTYQINVYEIVDGIIVDTGILYNNGNYQVND